MKHLLIISSLVSLIGSLNAATSIDIFAGELRDSTSTLVSDTSLWAIIYDENSDDILAGGLDATSAFDNLDSLRTSTIGSTFQGITIQEGQSVGGDRILRVFEVDSLNTSGASGVIAGSLSNIDYATEGVTQGGKWGIYWFPTLTLASPTLSGGNFEVGGIFSANAQTGGDVGTVFDAPDFSYTAAFLNTDQGGSLSADTFNAVLVPEPSSAVFGLVGIGAMLLRRRR